MPHRPLIVIAVALLASQASAQESPLPDLVDVRYSDSYDRCLLDIWLPPQDGPPAQTVIYFHGGAFVAGSKENIKLEEEFKALPALGIALVSCEYPFLPDVGASPPATDLEQLQPIFDACAEVVFFLHANSVQYNLDTSRFLTAGSSAGSVISQVLNYNMDLGLTGTLTIQYPNDAQEITALYDAGDQPNAFYTISAPDTDGHHPDNARDANEVCRNVGVPTILYGSEQSGLPLVPEGQQFVLLALDLINENTPRGCSPADITTTGATIVGQAGYGEPDGLSDLDDLGYYLTDWIAGGAESDRTTAGATIPGQPDFGLPDGMVDIDDLGYFLSFWLVGCA
ncbi:MAG: GC-type dockerin domain-anchored protein [Planctomycetota bacterium]